MSSKNPYLRTGLFLAFAFSAVAFLMVGRSDHHNHHRNHDHHADHDDRHDDHERKHRHHEHEFEQHFGDGEAQPMIYPLDQDISLEVVSTSSKPDFEIPTFPGCKGNSYEKRLECTREKYLGFIRKHLRKIEGKKGRVIVLFTVDLAGKVRDAELYEDTDAFLSAEVMRLVGIMQGANMRWTPGKVKGTPRALKMGLAINFGQRCGDCAEIDAVLSEAEWMKEETFTGLE